MSNTTKTLPFLEKIFVPFFGTKCAHFCLSTQTKADLLKTYLFIPLTDSLTKDTC